MPFLRTPKLKTRESLVSALLLAREEVALLVILLACAVGVVLRQQIDATDVRLWLAVLVIQAIPFAAAITMSVASAANKGAK